MEVAVRRRAGGHLDGGDAEGPDVAPLVVASLLVGLNHLRRHPERRPRERLALVPPERVRHLTGDAEIRESDLPGRAQQDVRRLDVAVDLPLAVEVVERHEQVAAHHRARLLPERLRLHEVGHAPAGHVFHRDGQTHAPLVKPRAEVLGHVLAVDLRERRDLALNVLHLILRLLQIHELHRDELARVPVDGAVDDAGRPAPDARAELEALARQRHREGARAEARPRVVELYEGTHQKRAKGFQSRSLEIW